MLENFYNNNHKRLVNQVHRRVDNRDLAEDIIQECFLRALRFESSYDPKKSPFRTWFNAIMNNTIYDARRGKLDDLTEPLDELSIGAKATDNSHGVLNRDEKESIYEALQSTDNPRHRRVAELFYVLGYSTKEITMIEEELTQSNVTTIVLRFRENVMKGS